MLGDDLLSHRQSHARSLRLRCIIEIEYRMQGVSGNPLAGIGHDELNLVVSRTTGQGDSAAGWRGLQGVEEKVQQGLGHLVPVQPEYSRALLFQHNGDAFRPGLNPDQCGQVVKKALELDVLKLKPWRAGEPEELLNDGVHPLGFGQKHSLSTSGTLMSPGAERTPSQSAGRSLLSH